MLVRRPLRESPADRVLSGILGDLSLLAFEWGERARLEVSFIQFRRERRWLIKGCFRRRLGTKPLGWRRSGLLPTTWSMLLCDLRLCLSRSFAGGGGREDESECRVRSFSMGGGGCSTVGIRVKLDSGRSGRSGTGGAPTKLVSTRTPSGKLASLPCVLRRLIDRPRLLGGSPRTG